MLLMLLYMMYMMMYYIYISFIPFTPARDLLYYYMFTRWTYMYFIFMKNIYMLLFTMMIINSPAAPRGGTEPTFKKECGTPWEPHPFLFLIKKEWGTPWGPNPEGVFFTFINNNYKLYLK
uniref:K7_07377p n=1 Tax=Saccharomyces cerevisiae (strain Kyokai no. 7 / NBRC 101557) TaxID=721032 RepID=G2HKF0_YEASK|nr:K7_07377p [Saccharomyces cerevisiae Kyokai no. 7]